MKRIFKLFPLLLMCLSFTLLSVHTVTATSEEAIALNVKNTKSGVSLSWGGDNSTSYSVFRKTVGGKYTKLTSVKGKKYTDKDVVSGEKYSYCIRKTKKIKSEHISVTYLDAPQIKDVIFSDEGTILVFGKVKSASKYAVYRKTADGKNVKLGSTKNLSFIDSTALKDTEYIYTVKAYKDGSFSAPGKLTAINLTSPEIISVKRQNGSLKISWNKTEKAENYIIYRRLYGKTEWQKLGTVSSDRLTYKDTTVITGKKYSYYVAASSGESESPYKNTFLSRTYIAPPENFTLQQKEKKVTLTWKKSEGATAYLLYKKTADGKWIKYKQLTPEKEKFTETLTSVNEKVSYKIKAVTAKGNSAFTETLTPRYVDPKKPMVALTYDDGPHPTHTHTILDVLEKYDARATFFVVGSRITAYSDCLERQSSLGCEIANHSYSHISLSTSKDKIVTEEISKTDSLIKKYSGQTCTIARAPGGSVGKALRLVDKPFIHWSVDTRDWECLSSSKIVSHIKRTVRDGSIILMHDLYGSTAAATKVIVPWLIKEGYQLVTVSEMMEAKGIELKSGRIYYNGYA